VCKWCGSKWFIKYGKRGGRQVCFCKVCRKKFSEPKELYWHHKPNHVVIKALDLYFKEPSLRKASDYLSRYYGTYVSYGIIYRWIKKKLIWVEGPGGSGKTTLVNWLIRELMKYADKYRILPIPVRIKPRSVYNALSAIELLVECDVEEYLRGNERGRFLIVLGGV